MVKERWSLDVMYKGMDDPKFKADWEELQDIIVLEKDKVGLLTTISAIRQRLHIEERMIVLNFKLIEYLSLRFSANTLDIEAENMINKIIVASTEMTASEVALQKSIAQFEPWEKLYNDEKLSHLRYYLSRIKEESKYLLSATEEELISSLNMSGGNAWSSLFDQLTANMEIEYNGEKCNLSTIRNFAYDADPKVRESAYKAEIAGYRSIETPVSFALNSIKRQAKLVAERKGFASPLDQAVFQSHMQRATLDALIGAMEKRLPIFRRYLLAKAKYLGHDGALPWWDIFAPVGSSVKEYSIEEAKDVLVDAFSKLHQPIADLIKEAFENEWIDFLPRSGKVGGAFCANLPLFKQSRILSNFNGSFDAVDTLAHELGHAYHGSRIQDHNPLNWDYSMPVAETASTFNETHLTMMALKNSSDAKEKLALLEGVLMNTCQTIVDIYSRFLFEKKVFDVCDQVRLTAEDCCTAMHQAQLAAYGEAIIEETLHPYMWACKGHYYSPDLGFYNFPYAFGSLLAMGLYSRFLQEGADFMPKYDQFLTMTTVASVEDTALSVGIDLTDENFWLSGLDAFGAMVDQFCALVDEAVKNK